MTTTKKRIEYARKAMLNIQGVYKLLECGAYVKPEHDGYLRYQLTNVV